MMRQPVKPHLRRLKFRLFIRSTISDETGAFVVDDLWDVMGSRSRAIGAHISGLCPSDCLFHSMANTMARLTAEPIASIARAHPRAPIRTIDNLISRGVSLPVSPP